MARIFISYRREDCGVAAGRLFQNLASQAGALEIVTDVDLLPPGVNYEDALQTQVASCDLVLAVLAKGWAGPVFAGERDFVRTEIGAALKRGIPVLPVLIEGATMAGADKLPAELSGLPELDCMQLADVRSKEGGNRLLETIEALIVSRRQGKEDARRETEMRLPASALAILPKIEPIPPRVQPAPALPPEIGEWRRAGSESEGRRKAEAQRTVERRLVSQRELDTKRQAERQQAQRAADAKLRQEREEARLASEIRRQTAEENAQRAADADRHAVKQERLAREAEARNRAEAQRSRREADARRLQEQQRKLQLEAEALRRVAEKEKLLQAAQARIQEEERRRVKEQAEAKRKAEELQKSQREAEVRRRAEERQKQQKDEEEKRKAGERLLASRTRNR